MNEKRIIVLVDWDELMHVYAELLKQDRISYRIKRAVKKQPNGLYTEAVMKITTEFILLSFRKDIELVESPQLKAYVGNWNSDLDEQYAKFVFVE